MENENNKNIYNMLNDIEIDLSEYEKEDFNDIEKMRIKKKFRKSIGKKKSSTGYRKYVSVASVAIVSLVIISITPIGTYASKVISDLVFDIRDVLGIEGGNSKYINTINKSIKKEDVTLRLNEVVLNNNELLVSLTTIYDKKIPKGIDISRKNPAKLYINDEFVSLFDGSSQGKVSKNNIDEVLIVDLGDREYDGVIDIKIDFGEVQFYEDTGVDFIQIDEVKGKFIFEFTIDTTEIKKSTKSVDIDKKINISNTSNITLDKYVFTPLSQDIYYTKNRDTVDGDREIVLKITDSFRNEIDFKTRFERDGKGKFSSSDSNKKISDKSKYIEIEVYEAVDIEKDGEIKVKLRKLEDGIKIDLE